MLHGFSLLFASHCIDAHHTSLQNLHLHWLGQSGLLGNHWQWQRSTRERILNYKHWSVKLFLSFKLCRITIVGWPIGVRWCLVLWIIWSSYDVSLVLDERSTDFSESWIFDNILLSPLLCVIECWRGGSVANQFREVFMPRVLRVAWTLTGSVFKKGQSSLSISVCNEILEV
jgi:hypothetical protein